MTASAFNPADVRRGYQWLDHAAGVTEVSVLHPDFKPGDVDGNSSRRAWPLTYYVLGAAQLSRIIRQYADERMVCYGLNPRTDLLRSPEGRVRSAKEADIAISQTLLLDVDVHDHPTPERLDLLGSFLCGLGEYWQSIGIKPPVMPRTGRGHHLLFAFPPVTVAEHPDFRGQLRTFKEQFVAAHQHDLNRLEAKVDSTQDLRRMVRVYGTAKPGVGIISSFPYAKRVPDERLREYLLQLTPAPISVAAPKDLTVAEVLPAWFPTLLDKDRVLHDLWHGKGKPKTADHSTSGYDYSIARHLLQAGKTDEDIATILHLRPTGAEERDRKGNEYLSRTVANAKARRRRKQ
jgi:hypothetical protein